MKPMTFTVAVDASPLRTFETFTDLRNAAQVVKAIVAIEVLTEGPIGVGTRFKETREMFGKQATEEMEITAFAPGELYVHEAKSHGCHYISTYTFTPDESKTNVTLNFEGRPLSFMAKMMGLLMGWMMKGMIRKCVAADFDDLRNAAENDSSLPDAQ